ncbi:tRNA lysidine(34) synthetase TilS [Candidatus Omnitrophota bacterium]
MKKKTITSSTFIKRVRDAIKQYDMLDKGDRVLVAVSGGADSVSLLRALFQLRRELGIEIFVANMDHCLRGKESESDSRFVKELSRELELPYEHKKVNVRSGGKKGTSTEEKAREKRYAFLKKAAGKNKCNVITTGHTMDDQAETVLMRVISGSSLSGITGIPPVRYEEGIKIIRPLIRVTREEILAFLGKGGAGYVEDSTNKDIRFMRNMVRIKILPFLEKYNPMLKRSLTNLSDTLREDLDFIEAEREKVSRHAKDRHTHMKVKDMVLQPKALRKEIFKELFKKAGGNVKKLTYRHWMDMDYFLKSAEKSKSLDFPGDIRVTKSKDEIVFRKRDKKRT